MFVPECVCLNVLKPAPSMEPWGDHGQMGHQMPGREERSGPPVPSPEQDGGGSAVGGRVYSAGCQCHLILGHQQVYFTFKMGLWSKDEVT